MRPEVAAHQAITVADFMIESIRQFCEHRVAEFPEIPEDRRILLRKVAAYVAQQIRSGSPADLVYICTHNSRRSHFGQVWGAVAAAFYKIQPVRTWSGGTEATAFHPNAIASLRRTGFQIIPESADENPVYRVSYNSNSDSVQCFSKQYSHPGNPQREFAAVMTCGDAEHNCPLIPGADIRVALTYDDPKISDQTPQQDRTYDARSEQIAREALWLFSQIT